MSSFMRSFTLGLLVFGVPVVVVASESSSITTPATQTVISNTKALKTQAAYWSLNSGEYQQYLDLMHGPLGKWNPTIDPLLALGMFAETPQQEQRFAELYAQQEFDLTERALQFQRAYRQERLHPNVGMLDQRLLAPYFSHQQQKSNQRLNKRLAKRRFVEGDRLLIFVSGSCENCLSTISHLMSVLSHTTQSGVDVYVAQTNDDNAVKAWATQHRIQSSWLDKQQLTLNRDEGLLLRLTSQSNGSSSDLLPIFLKRNDQFYRLGRESLGL